MKLAVLALVFSVTSAHADFVGSRAGWVGLDEVGKEYYAMGLFDSILAPIQGDELNSQKRTMNKCAFDRGFTSRDLVEIINSKYADLDNWKSRVRVNLFNGLTELCINEINADRATRGEQPLELP